MAGIPEWHKLEAYVQTRTEAKFSHSICPPCRKKLYPFSRNVMLVFLSEILILTEIPCQRGCNDQGNQTILVLVCLRRGGIS